MITITHHLFRLIPPFLFFFFFFELLNLTIAFMDRSWEPYNFYTIFLGSAVVAKVLIIVDNLTIINAFKNRALIYNVLWKTLLYSLGALIIRMLTHVIPALWSGHTLSSWILHFETNVDWLRFFLIQIWFSVLFLFFTAWRDLIEAIGYKQFKKIFFKH